MFNIIACLLWFQSQRLWLEKYLYACIHIHKQRLFQYLLLITYPFSFHRITFSIMDHLATLVSNWLSWNWIQVPKNSLRLHVMLKSNRRILHAISVFIIFYCQFWIENDDILCEMCTVYVNKDRGAVYAVNVCFLALV